MADVFVSYKSDDRPQVQALVVGLRAHGLSVWWDQDIPTDAPWELTIERELRVAKAAVVVWSPLSVVSENVRSEARLARQSGRLVQVFIARCDPPLFFGERQGVSLHGWAGETSDHRFQTVVVAVAAIIAGKPPPQPVGHAPARRPRWRVAVVTFAAVGVVLALLLGGLHGALCGPSAGKGVCRILGLAQPLPADPAATAALSRAAAIQAVTGLWDRQRGGGCQTPIRISSGVDAAGAPIITVSGPGGFHSTGQVISVDGGKVTSRDIDATEGGAGEVWEYQPNGSLMSVIDGKGTVTALVRCPGA